MDWFYPAMLGTAVVALGIALVTLYRVRLMQANLFTMPLATGQKHHAGPCRDDPLRDYVEGLAVRMETLEQRAGVRDWEASRPGGRDA